MYKGAWRLTGVDLLQFRDDVESDVGEFVLEQLEEEGEEMFDGVILAEERSEARDLRSEGGADVLRRIGGEISNARHQSCENDILLDQFGESCSTRVSMERNDAVRRDEPGI